MTQDQNFPPLKNDLILRAARGEKVEKTPAWVMRQAGRYLPEFRQVRSQHDFFTICQTPELACQVTLQPIDRYEGLLDAAIIFSDILVIPQALGLEVQMLEGKGPHFPNPIRKVEDLKRIKTDVDVEVALKYVYEAITLTRMRLNGRVPLFGFAGSPWTIFAYMVEGGGSKTLSHAKTWLFQNPQESKWLLQLIAESTAKYLVAQYKAGAQLLQIFDSWGGELSRADFMEFSLPYIQLIYKHVKSACDIPIVVFCKGAHYAVEELSRVFSIVQLDWTMETCENDVVYQGNLDPAVLYAPPEVIRIKTREMLHKFANKKHIANLGHGMHPDHNPEHLRVFLETIKE